MRRRPIVVICICFMVLILAASALDLPFPGEVSLPESLRSELSEKPDGKIYGQLYRVQSREDGCYLYLKNTILLVYSNQYHLNNSKISYKDTGGELAIGDSVCVTGSVYLSQKAGNPGQFDSASYDRARGISVHMSASRLNITKRQTDWIPETARQLRDRIKQTLYADLPENEAGILSTMLLGDKSGMDATIRDLYQKNGISHILAISGVHISILGAGLYQLLRRRLSIRNASIPACVFLVFYLYVTDFPVSEQRAVLMFILKRGADVSGRRYDEPTAIAAAACWLLFQNPEYLFDSGFILSFLAALCIYLLRRLEVSDRMFGFCLWLLMLPATVWFYFEISFTGVLMNLIILPGMSAILCLGLMGGVLGSMIPFAGKALLFPVAFALRLCTALCRVMTHLPFCGLITGRPAIWQMVSASAGILLFVFLFCRKKKGKNQKIKPSKPIWRIVSAAGILVIVMVMLIFRLPAPFSVTMVDIGQGDCSVLRSGYSAVIVDGGSTTVNEPARYRIVPFLKYYGIRHISRMILTHPDTDHMNGLEEMLTMIKNGELSMTVDGCIVPYWMKENEDFAELKEVIEALDIPITYTKKGEVYRFGEAKIKVVYPGIVADTSGFDENPNTGSLVFMLETKMYRMLFTGDIEGEGEEALLSMKRSALKADILKVAHHGSKYTSTEELLKKVAPKAALISAGIGNWYGHPHADTLQRLKDVGAEIWRTDRMGALTVGCKKGKVFVGRYLAGSE